MGEYANTVKNILNTAYRWKRLLIMLNTLRILPAYVKETVDTNKNTFKVLPADLREC